MTVTPTNPDQPTKRRHIILCGFMGTGKSTVGRLIGLKLKLSFVDTDALIEARQGQAISAIFAQKGEAFFRSLEHQLCQEIASWEPTVIATGGGMVIDPRNRDLLAGAGLLVCLDASPGLIAARLRGQSHRPLLAAPDPKQRIAELLSARAAVYGAIALHVNTNRQSPDRIAAQIIELWNQSA